MHAPDVMLEFWLRTLFLTLKKTNTLLCLLIDASLFISTHDITSMLSAFGAILQLMCYILIYTYFLTYLLTELCLMQVFFNTLLSC